MHCVCVYKWINTSIWSEQSVPRRRWTASQGRLHPHTLANLSYWDADRWPRRRHFLEQQQKPPSERRGTGTWQYWRWRSCELNASSSRPVSAASYTSSWRRDNSRHGDVTCGDASARVYRWENQNRKQTLRCAVIRATSHSSGMCLRLANGYGVAMVPKISCLDLNI